MARWMVAGLADALGRNRSSARLINSVRSSRYRERSKLMRRGLDADGLEVERALGWRGERGRAGALPACSRAARGSEARAGNRGTAREDTRCSGFMLGFPISNCRLPIGQPAANWQLEIEN